MKNAKSVQETYRMYPTEPFFYGSVPHRYMTKRWRTFSYVFASASAYNYAVVRSHLTSTRRNNRSACVCAYMLMLYIWVLLPCACAYACAIGWRPLQIKITFDRVQHMHSPAVHGFALHTLITMIHWICCFAATCQLTVKKALVAQLQS